jgi:hypothetical protein
MPTRPILSLTIPQLDSIPEYVELREPQIFQQGGIRAVVDPRRLEFGVPVRADLIVLQLLKDNVGVRPLYIARTTGGYLQALGLEPYSLTQGLANKIMTSPVAGSSDTLAIAGLGHLDLSRSTALWRGYRAPAAFVARGDWVDRPSIGIPATYIGTALLIGDAYQHLGRTADAEKMRRAAIDIGQATHTLDLFMQAGPPRPPAAAGSDAPRGTAVPVRP